MQANVTKHLRPDLSVGHYRRVEARILVIYQLRAIELGPDEHLFDALYPLKTPPHVETVGGWNSNGIVINGFHTSVDNKMLAQLYITKTTLHTNGYFRGVDVI